MRQLTATSWVSPSVPCATKVQAYDHLNQMLLNHDESMNAAAYAATCEAASHTNMS